MSEAITWKEQGDANFYALLKDGNWLAQVQLNGELMPSRQEAIMNQLAAAPKMLAALTALTTNPHINLGDLIYKVRESEGEGWTGPAVEAWSNAVEAAHGAIAAAKGETA